MAEGVIEVSVEEISERTALVFRPGYIKDKDSYFQMMSDLKKHCFYHYSIGYYIYFPSVEISILEDKLRSHAELSYKVMTERLFQRSRNLRFLSEFDSTGSIELLEKNNVLDSLKKSVILHDLNITKILSDNSDYIKDRLFKLSDIFDSSYFEPDHDSIFIYGVNKIKKDDIELLEDLVNNYNCIFLTPLNLRKDPKKSFELYNIVQGKRYKDFSEYRKLNMGFDSKNNVPTHRFRQIGCMVL